MKDGAICRVCFIGDAASPHEYNWSTAIAHAGHDVFMLSPRPRPDAEIKIVHVRQTDTRSRILRRLINGWRWLHAVRRARADIYHAHYCADYGPWACALLCKEPIVVTAMGSDVLHAAKNDFGLLTGWLTRLVLKRAAIIVSHSRFVADQAVASGARKALLHISLWGVDTTLFDFDAGARKRKRNEWGIDDETFIVLSPRGLDPIYDQETIIDGVAEFSRSGRKTVLVVPVLPRDAERTTAFEIRAKDAGVDLRLLAAVPHHLMPAVYAAADAVISLAKSDNVPRTILEAMACRRPVIARALPDLQEVFENRHHALLVTGSPEEITCALEDVATDPDLRDGLTGAGRRFIEENADIESDTCAIATAYRSILTVRDR